MFYILVYLFFYNGYECCEPEPNLFSGESFFKQTTFQCQGYMKNHSYDFISHNRNKCFMHIRMEGKFSVGVNFCNKYGTVMAGPRSKEEIASICNFHEYNTFFGAKRPDCGNYPLYFLSDGVHADPFYDGLWNAGQPNYNLDEMCVGYYINRCTVYDLECHYVYEGFSCEFDALQCEMHGDPLAHSTYYYNGMCLSVYIETPKTWADAELACRTLEGALVEIESDEMRQFIAENLKELAPEGLHVGGHRKTTSSQVQFSYTNSFMLDSLVGSSNGHFAYMNSAGNIVMENGRQNRPYTCQFDRKNFCPKDYVTILRSCYYSVQDYANSKVTYAECKAFCKNKGDVVPEPRTKREMEEVKLLVQHETFASIYLAIQRPVAGKYVYESDSKTYHGRQFLNDLGISDIDVSGKGASTLLSFFKEKKHVIFFGNDKAGYCTCKKNDRCSRDKSRCYADNFNYETNSCNECDEGHFGADCSIECSGEVCDMQGIVRTKCPKGRYGLNCENYCSPYCKDVTSCHSISGTCFKCLDYYYGFRCDKPCGRCKFCDSEGKCTGGCPPGYYGPDCALECNKNCMNGDCDFDTGKCNECAYGFHGVNCDEECIGLCDEDGNYIEECDAGKYGEDCKQNCSSACVDGKCSPKKGTCESCIEGTFGLYCERTCKQCKSCDKTGNCNFECQIGRFGQFCDQYCDTTCKNANCDKDGNCRECMDGYYGPACKKKCLTDSCDLQGNSIPSCEKGIYGPLCDKVCSVHCLDQICSQLSGTCDKCVKGYYGPQCKIKCSPCDECRRNGDCSAGCPPGTFGFSCSDKCKGNCEACHPVTGDCLECPLGKFGPNCSKSCNQDLCDKKSGKKLQTCTIGLYGKDCSMQCPQFCNGSCSKILGSCYGCINSGHYGFRCDKKCTNCIYGCDQAGLCLKPEKDPAINETETEESEEYIFVCNYGLYGKQCDKKCSEKCLLQSCDEAGKCLECPKGFYGDDCSLVCPTPNCDRGGEEIPDGCPEGLFGKECNTTCDVDCDGNCTQTLGFCETCPKGKYGRECHDDCKNCTECDRQGICIYGCPTGTFGDHCEFKCHARCRYNQCDTKTGACIYCSPGKYGVYCEKDCGNCNGKCNDEGICQGDCTDGYYGEKCDKICKKECFLGKCGRTGKCDECNEGYYGDVCENQCIHAACDGEGNQIAPCEFPLYGVHCDKNCSFACLNRKCNQLTGSCENCVTGLYGYNCDLKCIGCDNCDRKGVCISDCHPTLYGDNCERKCYESCLNGICDRLTGKCLDCPIGAFGEICESECPNKGLCDKATGDEISECKQKTYGENCEEKCPINCEDNVCSKEKGACFTCIKGSQLFGLSCENECGGCALGCHMNGQCNEPSAEDKEIEKPKCSFGWFGSACKRKCPAHCLRGDCFSDSGGCKACQKGFYGLDCFSKCKGDYCDVRGSVIPECPSGWYGSKCSMQCSDTCLNRKCTSTGHCLGCIQSFYGVYCEKHCDRCSNCDEEGKCISGCKFGTYGPRCEYNCHSACFAHNCEPTVGVCLECPVGLHGDFCEKKCKNSFRPCDEDGNTLTECDSGMFGEGCKQTCPISCKRESCTVRGTCSSCIDGFYGAACNFECGHCNTCNRGGTCVAITKYDVITNRTITLPRCANGLSGEYCDKECSSKCLALNCDDEGKCVECQDGKYGDACEKKCDGACDIKGNPIKGLCEKGKYGPDCLFDCSPNCLGGDCMKLTGTCKKCSRDRFGKICEKKCQGTTECDRTGKPRAKCFPGLFGERCEKKCHPDCLHGNCDKNGLCLDCEVGFFGGDCQSKCNSTVCDVKTGKAVKECPEKKHGKDCEETCSSNCKDQLCSTLTGTCHECSKGFFGITCELRCQNCADCDRNGMCLSDCFPGFTGANCDKGCPLNCYVGSCDKSGKCVECAIGYYGRLCDSICPERKLCDGSGIPLEECSKKWYGVNCTMRCPKPCRKGCSFNLGICNECKKYTYGRFCEFKCKRCVNNCDRQGNCFAVAASTEISLAGIGVAFILMVAIGVVTSLYLTRKVYETIFYEEEGRKGTNLFFGALAMFDIFTKADGEEETLETEAGLDENEPRDGSERDPNVVDHGNTPV